jgi:hypothetical protein
VVVTQACGSTPPPIPLRQAGQEFACQSWFGKHAPLKRLT